MFEQEQKEKNFFSLFFGFFLSVGKENLTTHFLDVRIEMNEVWIYLEMVKD